MPALPQNEDEVKKYKLDYDSPEFKKPHGFEQNAIYNSVISGIADFGRYIVDSAVRHFSPISFRERDKQSIIKTKSENLNPMPIRYWIVKRVFELGYNRELNGEYDYSARNFYGYSRHDNKIERIGKKYQWIAFYEIMAILSDNYKLNEGWGLNDRYDYYKGAWQLFLRNIDPAYITKNKDDEDDVIKTKKEWWEDKEYTEWNCPDSEWVGTIDDLPNPKEVIEKKDSNITEWLYLQHFVRWNEPKKIGIDRYEDRRKEIWYLIQGLLVKKSDKRKIIDYLKKQNFWGRWLPENGDDFSRLINREKFWSPAYYDTYRESNKIWEFIRDSEYKVIVSTESANGGIVNDKSGANMKYNIPCKYIFEGMKLKYSPIDGNLVNSKGELVVRNTKPQSVLIRKKDLTHFLETNDMEIIWTLLGEKFSFDNRHKEESYFRVPCGVYYLENEQIAGEIKMYKRDKKM